MKNIYEGLAMTDIDLIPKETPAFNGDYLCTWWNQCGAAADMGLTGEGLSEWRDALCQEAVFDTEKYYHPIKRELRGSLVFLLDDGWDIPLGTPNDDARRPLYGSIDPDSVKFSRFGDTPEKRLKGMSDKIKEMGYAGLGLWVSPQVSSHRGEGEDDPKTYWENRARWCAAAGILYWKVDWGAMDHDDDYRELITDCVHRCAPEIYVEHAVIQKPLTHNHNDDNFLENRAKRVMRQMSFADAYRTYDVLEPFDKVCTLQRAHEALLAGGLEAHSGRGLVNGENIYSVVAGLGLAAGIMNYNHEAKACINWHKFAPPFGIFDAEYKYSEKVLTDTLFFDTEICEWAACKGRVVFESAPAVMSRNCPLPKVNPLTDNEPFVIASKHPETKAYAVATIKRNIDPVTNAYFLADVEIAECEKSAPIGVFGVFNSLTVDFSSPVQKIERVLCQDLAGKHAFDITPYTHIENGKLRIDGTVLRYVGKTGRGHSNWSEPSVIIKIEE